MKKYVIEGVPRIYLKAISNIVDGEELRYNYGDIDLPWRYNVSLHTKLHHVFFNSSGDLHLQMQFGKILGH